MKARFFPLVTLIGAAASLTTNSLLAEELALSFTNESAKGQFNILTNKDQLNLGAGYTIHEGSRHIFNADLHAQGRTAIANLPTTAGLGLRAIGFNDDDLKGGGLAVGGYSSVNIPEVPGLSVHGAFHFAPEILSFNDADNLIDLEFSVSYRVIRNAEVFGGYRFLEADLKPRGDKTLDDGLVAGVRLFF